MRVETATPPGILVEGRYQRVISEHDGPAAQMVLEMRLEGRTDRASVTFDVSDLMTIVRLAKSSSAQRIREAVG
jgi:hypothetical protein